jgi:hypothetical protein
VVESPPSNPIGVGVKTTEASRVQAASQARALIREVLGNLEVMPHPLQLVEMIEVQRRYTEIAGEAVGLILQNLIRYSILGPSHVSWMCHKLRSVTRPARHTLGFLCDTIPLRTGVTKVAMPYAHRLWRREEDRYGSRFAGVEPEVID